MRPVFIGGCDRSGTTMLGSVIGAHGRCLCVPEAQFIVSALRKLGLYNKPVIEPGQVLEFIKRHERFRHWELDLEVASDKFRDCTAFGDLVKRIIRLYGVRASKPDPVIWVDHTPSNVKFVTTLLELYPEAKFIHLVRDGRAVAASVMPLDWGPNIITKAAHWWLERVSFGMAAESCYSGKVLRVGYEDLVSDTAGTMKRVCSFLGIDYDSQMEKADGFIVPPYIARQHSLVGKPPDKSRLDAWKRQLTPRQVEIFEYYSGDMLSYLGYEYQYGISARAPGKKEKLSFIWQEMRHGPLKKLAYKWRRYKHR
jgi:hypothetical protein